MESDESDDISNDSEDEYWPKEEDIEQLRYDKMMESGNKQIG